MTKFDLTQKKRILIVEDDEIIRETLHDMLEMNGYEAEEASSSAEALIKVKSFKPHLILTDYNMPGLSGLEMLKILRKENNYVSVIFISGKIDSQSVIDALKEGADDYIRKPFRTGELLARVETNLKNNELHRELFTANRKLQELVDHDHLTGLYNMRSIFEKIEYELKRIRRFKGYAGCVMLDIDDFKSINDLTTNHLFGSFVLKEMGQIISEVIREVDFAARFGGDEFLIFLTEMDSKRMNLFCERLRKKVEEHIFCEGKDSAKLTISLGFVVVGGEDEVTVDAEGMVKMADKALYQAKHDGRNKAVGF